VYKALINECLDSEIEKYNSIMKMLSEGRVVLAVEQHSTQGAFCTRFRCGFHYLFMNNPECPCYTRGICGSRESLWMQAQVLGNVIKSTCPPKASHMAKLRLCYNEIIDRLTEMKEEK